MAVEMQVSSRRKTGEKITGDATRVEGGSGIGLGLIVLNVEYIRSKGSANSGRTCD